jgi:tripartite-type tricarboxylate transporter receptor subunit TctC
MYAWQALFAPAGTPPAAVRRLAEAFAAALTAPDVAQKIAGSGAIVVAGGPDALAEFQRREIEKWRRVVREAAIELQ